MAGDDRDPASGHPTPGAGYVGARLELLALLAAGLLLVAWLALLGRRRRDDDDDDDAPPPGPTLEPEVRAALRSRADA